MIERALELTKFMGFSYLIFKDSLTFWSFGYSINLYSYASVLLARKGEADE